MREGKGETPAHCQETAGFLFKHPCDRDVFAFCAECEQAICTRHSHDFGSDTLCTTCSRTTLKEAKAHGRRYAHYEDDPYFYGVHHYDGYGVYGRDSWGHEHSSAYDGDDFTEADGESLTHEGDEGWETDMGAS